MNTQSVNQLRHIRNQINDLSVTDAEARQLEKLFHRTISLLNGIENMDHDFFENRKKVALKGFEGELSEYLDEYWEQKEKVEKINRFSQARQQAHHLLGTVLSTFN